ncbi:MAG: LysM peptidoglycan-binding domain-containing protein, partial [Proteobacteria bacterium]
MKYFLFLLLSILSTKVATAQNYAKHKVAKSETVNQIAKKYSVTPFDIFRLNPDAQNGVKENDILLIPSATNVTSSAEKPKTHVVAAGETLFSIARRFDVSVDNLKKVNADLLKDGLKSGQTISIPGGKAVAVTKPVSSSTPKPAASVSGVNAHVVQPGETKFSIAKKYGISVPELEKQNPSIIQGLPAGATLQIRSETRPSATTDPIVPRPKPQVIELDTPAKASTEVVKLPKKTGFANYEVKNGETLYSLTQQFDISQQELVALNPTLKDGVKAGMILKVPGKGSIQVEPRKDLNDLSKTIKKSDRKQLALLLPFNAAKITADTTKGTAERLKKDAFLN